ncbi:hypothetical protein DYB37_007605 [Aphanomyces astaci]|uniref:Uncharacterized protein n=2 Tax=Aphanomyces astaci TaxID=112090 RepID=A0A397B9E9_APHAT|nr:hypothetical protein DYB36_007536 [Aphanomyces astaci]RHY97115.1 hypothetical protein DYB35_009552 [Aphanomyces astaci]RHZ28517.1 hypothetical protein DYB37_007605 [Aphanomyces astaci]RLO00043.1 hypothetical protein DYB28_003695 [Aphanomyces astaci]
MQPFGLVLAFVAVLAHDATAQAACSTTGRSVTVSGFVMDNFCIQRGTLLDNPDVKTLEGPDAHSIHCLVDIKRCVDSKYTILAPPGNGSDLYSVKYQLDETATATAKSYAEAARELGGKKGFSVTVTGVDDGTPVLKCVEVSKDVVVDGKALSLPATTSINSAATPFTVGSMVLALTAAASALLV